jgi:tetratricopeptide (TPR) repeat protein
MSISFSPKGAAVSPWKALKWLTYTALATVAGLFTKELFSKDHSAFATWLLGIFKPHLFLSGLTALGFAIVCVSIWLFADWKEALENVAGTAPLFVSSRKLLPDHLSVVAFNERYVEHAEVAEAHQRLSSKQRLFIIGRPSAGKTRLAFNLAKQSKRNWILRVSPGFPDWKSLDLPRIPRRCKVLWIVDDVDKFLGKSDIGQGERILGGKCRLKMIVTCRSGNEYEQARSDKELAAFLDRLSPPVVCSDFAKDELVSLARKVNKPADPNLYDVTPGSVLLDLELMRKHLENAGSEAQAVMKALFLLRTALIFSPSQELVAAVTRASEPKFIDDKIEAAVAALVRDDFLRKGQPLAPSHDSYLTADFFPYYTADNSRLEDDLVCLGNLVQQHGTARDLQSLGVYWNSREKYELAMPYLQKAGAAYPNDPVLAFELGLAFGRTNRLSQALEIFRKVLQMTPDNATARYNLGVILGQLNRSEDAIQEYDDVLRRFSNAPEPALREMVATALVNKGVSLGQLNRSEDAIQAYDEVLRRFSDAPEPAVAQNKIRKQNRAGERNAIHGGISGGIVFAGQSPGVGLVVGWRFKGVKSLSQSLRH